MTLRRRSGSKWLYIPMDLFRVVRGGRRMDPTPITYVIAGGIGLVLGLGLDWLFGWPWWVVASGFVVVVWLFFLTSAFWDPGSRIGDDLLRVISPDRARARESKRLEEAVASGSLVGFEMPEWEGVTSIVGWGGSPEPQSLTIRHGDPTQGTTWVEVTARTGREAEHAEHWLKDQLVREMMLSQVRRPEGLAIEELHRWHLEQERQLEQVEPPPWTLTQINIGGEPVPGELALIGDQWVAVVRVGDVLVDITAKGVEAGKVTLRRFEDPQPYLQELAERITRAR